MAEVVSKKFEFPGVLLGQDVKAKRDPRDLSFIYLAVAASLAAMLIVFGFVWSRLMVVNAGYEISRANSAREALLEQNKRLRLEYVRLKSPERIERMAAEMGYDNPRNGQIIVLR